MSKSIILVIRTVEQTARMFREVCKDEGRKQGPQLQKLIELWRNAKP